MTENIYTILDWVFGTLAAIIFLYAIRAIASPTGWKEESKTNK